MSEIGEAFRERREQYRIKRYSRLEKNMNIIKQCDIQYKTDINFTVLFKTQNGTLSFFPTKNKFMIKNKVYFGDANNVLGFIRNMSKDK